METRPEAVRPQILFEVAATRNKHPRNLGMVIFLAFCLFLQTACARAQQFDNADTTVPTELTFKLSGGFLIVVKGRIGTLNKLKFILDTGVSRSVVDRKTADKFRLVRHTNQVFDFDRVNRAESATFPEVQLGPIRLTNISMLIANLADFSSLANDADALIGSDILSLTSFTIDYDQKKAKFSSLPNPESAAISSDVALLTVDLLVQNQHLRLLVDTGFPYIVLFEDRLRKRMPQLRLEHVADEFHANSRYPAKKAILPRINLGATETDLGVLLMEGPPNDVLNSSIDGLLGIAALKARRIHFDYITNRLAWEGK